MADVLIEGAANSESNAAVFRPQIVWVDASVGYAIFATASALVFRKTTDGGVTWGSQQTIVSASVGGGFAVWAEWWTPEGEFGWTADPIIHIAMQRAGTNQYQLIYASIDLGDNDAIDSEVLVSAAETASTVGACGIVTSRQGVILVLGSSTASRYAYINSGGTFESFVTLQSGVQDYYALLPGPSWDIPFACVYFDSFPDQHEFWFLAGGGWERTQILHEDDDVARIYMHGPSAIARTEDGLKWYYTFSGQDTDTIRVYEIDFSSIDFGSEVTELTPVTTEPDSRFSSILVDPTNDDIYVTYTGSSDGSETALSEVKAYYVKSTDGGATWGPQQPLSEDAADDLRGTNCGTYAPVFRPIWFNDDLNAIFCNPATGVVFGAEPTNTGTNESSFPSLTSAASGTQGQSGAAASSFPSFTSAASGTHGQTGTNASSFPSLSAAASGAAGNDGQNASTFPVLSAAASGSQAQTGANTSSFPSLSSAAQGLIVPEGANASTFPGFTSDALGLAGFDSIGISTFPGLTSDGTGGQAIPGSGSSTLPGLVAAGSGGQTIPGSGSSTLPGLTSTASGTQLLGGAAISTLPALGSDATGGVSASGAANSTFPFFASDSAGIAISDPVYMITRAVASPVITSVNSLHVRTDAEVSL